VKRFTCLATRDDLRRDGSLGFEHVVREGRPGHEEPVNLWCVCESVDKELYSVNSVPLEGQYKRLSRIPAPWFDMPEGPVI